LRGGRHVTARVKHRRCRGLDSLLDLVDAFGEFGDFLSLEFQHFG
jgi:hypothetical protein